jgi:hypothetical protein
MSRRQKDSLVPHIIISLFRINTSNLSGIFSNSNNSRLERDPLVLKVDLSEHSPLPVTPARLLADSAR